MIRVSFGSKFWFGNCVNIFRRTCSTNGYSEGTNKISVNIAASNVLTECIGGQEHLTFKIDAKVIDEADGGSYGKVIVGKKGDCNLKILGIKIGSINNKIQQYATRLAIIFNSRQNKPIYSGQSIPSLHFRPLLILQ